MVHHITQAKTTNERPAGTATTGMTELVRNGVSGGGANGGGGGGGSVGAGGGGQGGGGDGGGGDGRGGDGGDDGEMTW